MSFVILSTFITFFQENSVPVNNFQFLSNFHEYIVKMTSYHETELIKAILELKS